MKLADVEAAERVTAFLVAAKKSVSESRRDSLLHSRTVSSELFVSSSEFVDAVAALQFRNCAAWLGGATTLSARLSTRAPRISTQRGRLTGMAASCGRCTTRVILTHSP